MRIDRWPIAGSCRRLLAPLVASPVRVRDTAKGKPMTKRVQAAKTRSAFKMRLREGSGYRVCVQAVSVARTSTTQ